MKTNVKNGAFYFGEIPVDTASIKLCDARTGEGVVFETLADGLYPVIAETNEEGIVTYLVIDVSWFVVQDAFGNSGVIEIDEEDILVKDGNLFGLYDEEIEDQDE